MRSLPIHRKRKRQPIERNVAIVAPADPPIPVALALTMRRETVEVARTAVIAVARDDDVTFDFPAWVLFWHYGFLAVGPGSERTASSA